MESGELMEEQTPEKNVEEEEDVQQVQNGRLVWAWSGKKQK